MTCSSKEILSKFIEPVFTDKFPKGYINDVDGWGIPKEILHSKLPDGTYKLLTLDIDFGNQCRLKCPHCFRKESNALHSENLELSYSEKINLIKQGKELGLRSVKFLGAGEPDEEPDLLRFLEELRSLDIRAAIFTKGHVLGSDELAEKCFSEYGIRTAEELVGRLRELDVSILLGFNSFGKDMQDKFTGVDEFPKSSPMKNYVEMRNKALINLVKAGFNKFVEGQATRLALIAAPIKPENIDEIFDIYKWGRKRNIYVLSCPTTNSGLGRNEASREKEGNFEKYLKDLEDLYVKIYKWNIKKGLMTIEQFKEEGVSLYPGCHPCNQVAAGFYITLKGVVTRCPGRDDDDCVVTNDIRKSTLKDAWIHSKNYELASEENRFNYHCIARDGHFFEEPQKFYGAIMNRVLDRVSKN